MPRFALDFLKTHITMRAESPEAAIAWTEKNARVPAAHITCRLLPDTNPPSNGHNHPTMSKKTTGKAAPKKAAAKEAKPATKTLGDRVEKAAARKEKPIKAGMSGLDAAAMVLKEAKVPMGAKEIVASIQERKLSPKLGGATPHATIYAAMITEIAKKGAESRFARAAEKGKFTAA